MRVKKVASDEHGPRHATPAGRSVFYDLFPAEKAAELSCAGADCLSETGQSAATAGDLTSECVCEAPLKSAGEIPLRPNLLR